MNTILNSEKLWRMEQEHVKMNIQEPYNLK